MQWTGAVSGRSYGVVNEYWDTPAIADHREVNFRELTGRTSFTFATASGQSVRVSLDPVPMWDPGRPGRLNIWVGTTLVAKDVTDSTELDHPRLREEIETLLRDWEDAIARVAAMDEAIRRSALDKL